MKTGFHVMPANEYHADPCPSPSLSNSIAKVLLNESPLKAWHSHPKLNPHHREEQEDKFDIGTAGHASLLEGAESSIVVVDANDWRTNVAKEQRDAARAAGKVALLKRHHAAVVRMKDAALAFIESSEIAEFWTGGESELTAIWREGPLWLRCRFDRIKDRRDIIDYKTTENASPDTFSRQITRMGYHVQDAFYRRGARILGAQAPRFAFLAQSVEPPHECSLHALDPALQEIADYEVERAINIWRECITKDKWPSYGGRIHYAIPTTYMMQEHEMHLQVEAA